MSGRLKKGEFRLADENTTMYWNNKNPYKSNAGWECSRCWQWNKRYATCYEVETYNCQYDVCETCVKLLGLVW